MGGGEKNVGEDERRSSGEKGEGGGRGGRFQRRKKRKGERMKGRGKGGWRKEKRKVARAAQKLRRVVIE